MNNLIKEIKAIWFAISLFATSKVSGVPHGTKRLLSAFGGVANNVHAMSSTDILHCPNHSTKLLLFF